MDRILTKRKIKPKVIFIPVVTILILLLFLLSKNYEKGYKIKKSELIISKVSRKEINEFIQVRGMVVPCNKVSIESKENGTIRKILKPSGSYVEEGETIIVLENDSIKKEYLKSIETLEKTKNESDIDNHLNIIKEIEQNEFLMDLDFEIEKLKGVLDRNKDLYNSKFISRESFLNSEKEYNFQVNKRKLLIDKIKSIKTLSKINRDIWAVDMKSIKENIQILKDRIKDLEIKALTSGVVNFELLDIGQSIGKQDRVAFIEKQNNFKVIADIDEYYLGNISLGDKGTLITKEGELELKVSLINPEVVNSKIKVEFNFNEENHGKLKSGQKLNVKIDQSETEVKKVIKKGGFYKTSGGKWIFKIEGNVAYKVPITIGIKNKDYLEVISGIEENDMVIISNADRYKKYEKLVIEGM